MTGVPVLSAQHLGSLHAYETALLMLVAFGPFVVLVIVVLAIRRRDVEPGGADRDDPGGPRRSGPGARSG